MSSSACEKYILPNTESQFSPSQRTTLLADSIVYVNSAASISKKLDYVPQFKSGREYLQYKKAKILSGSEVRPNAIQPSSIVNQLNAFTLAQGLCPKPKTHTP